MNSNQSGNVNISEYKESIESEYIQDREKFHEEIITLSSYMNNANDLAKHKNVLYKRKQQYIKRKFEVADKIVFVSKNLSILKRTKINNYKFGNVKNNSGGAVKPANDFERKLYLEADLSQFEETKNILNNHMGFIEDSIKNVSDMIFGIPYVIQLEEFKQHLK